MFDENKNGMWLKSLEELGLDDKTARVYLSLLRLPETGTTALMRATDLHGQYVYQALDRLEELSLVQHVVKHGRKKFSAKHPRSIARLIDRKKQIADELAESLATQVNLPKNQRFEIFQGQESYTAHEFDLLHEADEGSELLIIGGSGDQFVKTMANNLATYESERLTKRLTVRYIGSTSQRDELAKKARERELFAFRLLPGLFTGAVNTNIWPKALSFNIFGDPVMSFVVWNPLIAGSYRSFFETLWQMAGP